MIVCTVVFNVVYALPILRNYVAVDVKFRGEAFRICESSNSKLYTIIAAMLYSGIPLTVIVAMNMLILLKIYQHSKTMKKMCTYQTESAIQWRLILKTLPVLMSLSLMFFITTVPSAVILLLVTFKNSWAIIDSESSDLCSRFTLWSIIDLVRIGNYSLNFFLYCLTSKNVRRELAIMFARSEHNEVSRSGGK